MNVVLEIVGWVGSAVLVVSLLQTNILRLRMINLAGCVILLLYNALIGVWPMVGLNVALAAINLYFIAGLLRGRDDQKNYTVIEVDPTDRYLAHVLAVHGKDIAAHNPSFSGAPDPEHLAFLVQRGPETIGVVLVSDAGDQVAQIDLDYVTPRFRDFSPGQFVFGHSDVFVQRGFRQILTPPDMVNPYYARLGFREVGDRYVKYLAPATG